jgi:hypothetical protein
MRRTFEPAFVLSVIIIFLAIIAAAGGLFIPNLYADSDIIKRAWYGSDMTTLFLVIPLLIVSLSFVIRGSLRAQLIWIGLVGYMLYNYAFYLFGATFNKFFLVYVALFAVSLYALIIALSNLPLQNIQEHFDKKTPVKTLSIFMIVIALPLAIFELSQALTAIFSGTSPAVPPLIFALDLSFVIPNMILAAVLLWKHRRWGYILTAMMMVKGFTYGINLIISAASVADFSLSGDWDALTPFYLFIAVGSLLGGWSLLKNVKTAK